MGNCAALVGTQSAQDCAFEIVGPESFDQELLDRSIKTKSIVLPKKACEGQTIEKMNFTVKDNCALLNLIRAGMDLPLRPGPQIRCGDILVFSGTKYHLQMLAKRIGFAEKRWQETDLVTYAFGIAMGLLIARLLITIGRTKIGLGSAGGLLVSRLTFGILHSRFILVEGCQPPPVIF